MYNNNNNNNNNKQNIVLMNTEVYESNPQINSLLYYFQTLGDCDT